MNKKQSGPYKTRFASFRAGFTLVEMLVVIGIIGLLAAALLSSFSMVKRSARQTQAQALASEVATALTVYLQRNGEWPQTLLDRTEMDTNACLVLKGLLDVDTSKYGLDRFGLLDPWGRAALKKNPTMTSAATIIDGGTKLSDHLIQYRLDENYNGKLDPADGEETPEGVVIRASAIAWSRGPDGKDDFNTSGKRYPLDDQLSWKHGAARAEK